MRSFKEYLTESKKTYEFKVKVAGDCPEDCATKIKECLGKFSVEKCSEGKSMPIQERHHDFPALQNCEVTSFDVSLAYPTTSTEVQAIIAEKLNLSGGNVIVRTPLEEQEVLVNLESAENENKEALLNSPLEKDKEGQKLVGAQRTMDLLKELQKSRNQGEQYKGVNDKILAKKLPKEKSVSAKADKKAGAESPVGSRQNAIPDPFKGR